MIVNSHSRDCHNESNYSYGDQIQSAYHCHQQYTCCRFKHDIMAEKSSALVNHAIAIATSF